VICGNCGASTTVLDFITSNFLSDITRLCLNHKNAEIQQAATSATRCICSSMSVEALRLVLQSTVNILESEIPESVRVRGCHLIAAVANVSGPSFRPFVRSLFPLVMKLMRDRNIECSEVATSLFSSLIQLAPLVRLEESILLGASSQDVHTRDVIDHLILGKPIPPCELPANVSQGLLRQGVVLRTYQEEGISWLHFLQSVHLSGALCDSMGLGKTLQALVSISLAHEKGSGAAVSLVVAPSTLTSHWIREVHQFFPGSGIFRPIEIIGAKSARTKLWKSLSKTGYNLVITSFSVLRSDVEELANRKFAACVLDEGHLLRNPKTATARASRRICADHKLILSGTIIQNRIDDLWAIFDFLMPNFLGTSSEFWKNYGGPIAKSQGTEATADEINEGTEKLKALHQKVLPFILRREKEQVLKELPPKNIMILRCRMSDSQTNIYKAFSASAKMKKSLAALQRALQGDNNTKSGIGSDVLKTLFFLRLLCTHPFLVAASTKGETTETNRPTLGDSGKLLALAEILRMVGIKEDIVTAADNDTSLLYCDEEDMEQQRDAFSSIVGAPSVALVSNDATNKTREDVSKCLIFAQFSQSLDIVESLLLKESLSSIRYLRLDGRVPPAERVAIAEQFNSDPAARILLLTTRVGSLGLNLTGADTVVSLIAPGSTPTSTDGSCLT